MKACHRFHFADIERGDVLTLTGLDEKPITITVANTYVTQNFGPVILDKAGEQWYVQDYETIEVSA